MGEIVARGAIKVDARKARDKLRDHLLPDLHLYANEIVRAAVSLGAKQLTIETDADDAIFTFDGLVPLEQLISVRDHVLSPGTSDAARLLGLAVNAALGFRPSFVDLIRAESGKATRVRFRGDDDPVTSDTDLSRGMIPNGLRFQLRRAPSLETLGRLVTTGVPPEIGLLLAAIRDAPIEIIHLGKPVGRPKPTTVVRLDIEDPGVKRAWLEISAPGPAAGTDFLEHGVRLVFLDVLHGAWTHRGMPIRIVVDAARLPTNASRSQIRMDAELMQRLATKTPAALERAIELLVERRGEPAVADALGAIVAQVVVLDRHGVQLPAPLRSLLDLPLLQDALGRWMKASEIPRGPFYLYEGDTPIDAELAIWLAGVPWNRKTAIDACYRQMETRPAHGMIAQAHAARDRRERALSHPASPPRVGSGNFTLRRTFDVTDGPYEGLSGEIALASKGNLASVRFFVEGRPIETWPLPGVTLPIVIALTWPNRIRPRFAYDGVDRDALPTQGVLFALRFAAIEVARETRDPDLARLAVLAALSASRELKDGGAPTAGLFTLPVWPTTDGRLVSTHALGDYVKRTGVLCTGPADGGAAVDGRPVVVAEYVQDAAAVLGGVQVVAYGEYLKWSTTSLELQAEKYPIVTWLEDNDVRGFVTPGSGHMVFHAGRFLGQFTRADDGLLVVDDPFAVPRGAGPYLTPVRTDDAVQKLIRRCLDRCERGELEDVASWLVTVRRPNDPLAARLAMLPTRIAERRRARAKEILLGRPESVPKLNPAADRNRVYVHGQNQLTIALAPTNWTSGRVEIFFEGRSIGIADIPKWKVIVRADLGDEALFDERFAALTSVGMDLVADMIDEAVVELGCGLILEEAFGFDEKAIAFVDRVYESMPDRISGAIANKKWLTVQQQYATLQTGANRFGQFRYAPYLFADDVSPYDAAALAISGPAVVLLRKVGYELLDVTGPIARLQAQRRRGQSAPRPQLEGRPTFVRRTLAELGVTSADGEMEIASTKEVRRVDDAGVAVPVTFDVPVPVRLIFRGDDAREEIVSACIALAAEHVRKEPHGPASVRDALRAHLSRAGIRPSDFDLRIWPDTNGAFLSIDKLKPEKGKWLAYTRVPRVHTKAVLLLQTDEEVHALGKHLKIADHTEKLEAAAAGAERRRAPPLLKMELSVEERAKCIVTFRIDAGEVEGEGGFLAPAFQKERGVAVHTTMRFVTRIPDSEGWPILARVEAKAQTTRAFDQLQHKHDVSRIQSIVRDEARKKGMAGAQGITVCDAEFLGSFVIDAQWPEAPVVEVRGDGFLLPDHIPRARHGVVPVRGRVFTTKTPDALVRLFDRVLPGIKARLDGIAPEQRRAYEWDLALHLDPLKVEAELAKDRPDPILTRVVVRRAPQLLEVRKSLPEERGELAQALRRGLDRLHLTGNPVKRVEEVKRGRAVRYEDRILYVNPTHDAVKRLAGSPTRELYLLLAAVSEINRELEEVTDAEERAVLLQLLR